ncbi:MAG: LysR-family transcriptional regulator [uncultured Caballeronia sp.]|nr:MAG: LysR-family transcriptional regulator [uncultured Caballeronia sp.]
MIGHVPWLGGDIYQQQLYTQDWLCLMNKHHPRVRGKLGLSTARKAMAPSRQGPGRNCWSRRLCASCRVLSGSGPPSRAPT